MSKIPEWAIDEALRRCGVHHDEKPFSAWRDATYAKAVELFAEHIAEHEEPPVDPLLIEAREIAISESYGGRARWAEAWREKIMRGDDDREDRVKVALAALKRGIEIGKSNA